MTKTDDNSQASFSSKMAELEAVTTWFESEDVDLNEALTKFERGMSLIDELKRELKQVENRVEKIKAKFDGPSVADLDSPHPIDDRDEPSLFA